MSDKVVVVYGRVAFCPDLARAQRFLEEHTIAYQQINIDQDSEAGKRVENWVGHRSVPTIVIANKGEVVPFEEPAALSTGRSARSVDRGSLITEPSNEALKTFLQNHGII